MADVSGTKTTRSGFSGILIVGIVFGLFVSGLVTVFFKDLFSIPPAFFRLALGLAALLLLLSFSVVFYKCCLSKFFKKTGAIDPALAEWQCPSCLEKNHPDVVICAKCGVLFARPFTANDEDFLIDEPATPAEALRFVNKDTDA